ncbi:hypothetical protein [Halomonas organivorans]|uniref:Uncharacterized protein n=1 Tax=Halomonas organivorans TaxID=257772 RepID=A0A7W5BXY8_9GAMM|nr:hypothetical protein [Halomonas organivorans]MBB3141205.1 hypothetical protein [Halomonas organivorans]
MIHRQRLYALLRRLIAACLSPLRGVGRQCDRLAVAIERRWRR